jgi:hypothetical protein
MEIVKRWKFTDIVKQVSMEDLVEAVWSNDPDRLATLLKEVPFTLAP